MPAVPEAIVVF